MWPFIRKSRDAREEIHLLGLLGDAGDRAVVEGVCGSDGWIVSFAGDVNEGRSAARRLRPHIILFDRGLAESGWREVMNGLAEASPGACILLASTVVDANLWNEVVRNGGYEVLRKPFDAAQVSRAVRLAWSYWSSRQPSARK